MKPLKHMAFDARRLGCGKPENGWAARETETDRKVNDIFDFSVSFLSGRGYRCRRHNGFPGYLLDIQEM